VEPHDEQQARVVERLRAANGAPVSFDELREMGVENPALLCYELAAVGVPVERPREPGRGALALSVRLEQFSGGEHLDDGGQRQDREQPEHGEPLLGSIASLLARASWRRPLGRLRTSRPLVAGGVVVALAVAVGIGLALGQSSGHTAASLSAAVHHPHASVHAPRAGTSTGGARRASVPDRHVAQAVLTPNAQRKQITVSPVAAASFEAEGHQLLATGRYVAAIGDLRSAIQASGGSLSRCAEPTSEACLTYAYALYDLGRALQLDGDPGAAIPVLSERLRIDNQREAVQQELDVARSASA
jgi:tetratricopeptide (TPR) repeat protein